MKNYSIVRVGKEYVVQADEKSILKIASRRRAARLVSDATELMDSPDVAGHADAAASIDCDPGVIPDPRVLPDPGDMTDLGNDPLGHT
jgi:hypothetical protein